MDKKNVLSCKCMYVVKCSIYCMYGHVKEHINPCNTQLVIQPYQLNYRTPSVVPWLFYPSTQRTAVYRKRHTAQTVRWRCFRAAAQLREGFAQL